MMKRIFYKYSMKAFAVAVAAVFLLITVSPSLIGVKAEMNGSDDVKVYDIRINDLDAPIGIDTPNPVFSWKLQSNHIGAKQTAYHIIVTDQEGEQVWNTDWVESGDCIGVPYAGEALVSSQTYTVEIAVKDETGTETQKATSRFVTALLTENAFADTQWISYSSTGAETTDITTLTNYTVDFDFRINNANQGFALGMSDDLKNYVLFQVSTQNSSDDSILFRPHVKVNGAWSVTPTSSNRLVLNDAIGYNDTEVIGKLIHERLVVNGREVALYFGADENSLVYAGTFTHSTDVALGKIGFRHNLKNPLESCSYDNFVIKNQNGTVLYQEDFSSGNSGFDGTINEEVVDGMLLVGSDNETYTEGVIVLKSFGTYSPSSEDNMPAFRKEVAVKEGLSRAMLYTSGLGIYESYINGARVGNLNEDGSISYDELKPGYTKGAVRRYYNTYDVTHMLQAGETNALSSIVTDGWWSANDSLLKQGDESAYFAKLILFYSDGTKEEINTDTNWKTARVAPVQADTSIYNGERYDATVDTAWMLPNYDDANWSTPKENTEFTGTPIAQADGFVSVRKDLEQTPVALSVYQGATDAISGYYGRVNTLRTYTNDQDIILNPEETLLVDFGQNFVGRERFTVTSERGTVITVDHGEMLNDGNGAVSRGNDGPEGSIYEANYRTAASDTQYVTAGTKQETWNPAFSFYGFRYAEIRVSKTTTFHSIVGEVLTSVIKDTAEMETADADINQLISNIRWSMYGNYLSVPTDCPQRDERLGWLGDTQIFAETGLYLGENKNFLRKFLADIRDGQITDSSDEKYGAYPAIAPSSENLADAYGAFGWADCGIILTYYLYMMSGDTSVIDEMWSSMRLYMDEFLQDRTYGGTTTFGDWLSFETTTATGNQMLGVSFHALDARMMAEMAKAIGDLDAAEYYTSVYQQKKEFYNSNYVNTDGTLKESTQTVCAYALYTDMVDDTQPVVQQLIANIEQNGNQLQTGFLGTAILLPALTKVGETDTAYKLLLQHENPSWLYSVDQGATTIWERWNSYTVSDGFGAVSMNSFNHYAYGAVLGWMYSDMAGIGYDPEAPGFQSIVLSPKPDASLSFVNAAYESPYGRIESNMRYEDKNWHYTATVPANTTAKIHLPVEKIEALTVNGETVENITQLTDGIAFVGYENGIATFDAVAGTFSFTTAYLEKHTVNISLSDTFDAMPPIEAQVKVNGEVQANSIPASLKVASGDVITATASCLNFVDYVVKGWSTQEEILSTDGALEYTVTGSAEITLDLAEAGYVSIAEGKEVTAQSANSDWAAAHLTDGIKCYLGGTKGWSSGSVGSNISGFTEVPAVIDLGQTYHFDRFHLYPRNDILSSGVLGCPTSFKIYVSDDNSSWEEVYSAQSVEVTNGYAPIVIQLEQSVSGRYVKLGVTAISKADQYGTGYVQLSELGVYCTNHTFVDDICSNCGDINKAADSVRYKIEQAANGKFDDTAKAINIRAADAEQDLKQGIRVKTSIDTTMLKPNYIEGYTVTEYGTLVARTDRLGEDVPLHPSETDTQTVLTGVAYAYDLECNEVTKNIIYEKHGNQLTYTGVLVGITTENYDVEFSVRSYVVFSKQGEKDVIVYGGTYDLSIKAISESILSTPNIDESLRQTAVGILTEYNEYLGRTEVYKLENWSCDSWASLLGDNRSYVNLESAKWQNPKLTLTLKKNTTYKFNAQFYQYASEEIKTTVTSMQVFKNIDGTLTNIYRTTTDKYYWSTVSDTNASNLGSISATFTTTNETEIYVLQLAVNNIAKVSFVNLDISVVE